MTPSSHTPGCEADVEPRAPSLAPSGPEPSDTCVDAGALHFHLACCDLPLRPPLVPCPTGQLPRPTPSPLLALGSGPLRSRSLSGPDPPERHIEARVGRVSPPGRQARKERAGACPGFSQLPAELCPPSPASRRGGELWLLPVTMALGVHSHSHVGYSLTRPQMSIVLRGLL